MLYCYIPFLSRHLLVIGSIEKKNNMTFGYFFTCCLDRNVNSSSRSSSKPEPGKSATEHRDRSRSSSQKGGSHKSPSGSTKGAEATATATAADPAKKEGDPEKPGATKEEVLSFDKIKVQTLLCFLQNQRQVFKVNL